MLTQTSIVNLFYSVLLSTDFFFSFGNLQYLYFYNSLSSSCICLLIYFEPNSQLCVSFSSSFIHEHIFRQFFFFTHVWRPPPPSGGQSAKPHAVARNIDVVFFCFLFFCLFGFFGLFFFLKLQNKQKSIFYFYFLFSACTQ